MSSAMYQRPINLPPFDLAAGTPWQDKYLLPLEGMQPFNFIGKQEMPETVEIVGCRISNQMPFPAGSSGNFRVAVATPDYIEASGCPTSENCTEFGLLSLGTLRAVAGGEQDVRFDFPQMPILYRRGIDKIFIGPELPATQTFEFHVAIMVNGPDSMWPADSGTTVWSLPLTSAASGGPFCIRNLVAIGMGGGHVDVQFVAPVGGCTIINASVGIQASGPNVAAAPVPLLFNGQTGITLGRLGRARGKAALAMTAGQSLLVNVMLTGAYAFHAGSGQSWVGTTDSYASANMLGTVGSYGNIYGISGVRVLP